MEVTRALFDRCLDNPAFVDVLRSLDVAEEDQSNLFGMLDVDCSGTIDLKEFRQGISKVRGAARRSDLVSLELLIRRTLEESRKVISFSDIPSTDSAIRC